MYSKRLRTEIRTYVSIACCLHKLASCRETVIKILGCLKASLKKTL